jgi:hypothetical protein
MSDFIRNALRQSFSMHACQSLAHFEKTDDGEPALHFATGRSYAAEAVAALHTGSASPYLLTVATLGVASMKNEALIHGFCSGLQEALTQGGGK